jgi:hypothetical protein
VLQLVLAEIRTEIAAQLPRNDADVAALEAELATTRVEQKRLAKAVAMADDVPELVSELRKRSARKSWRPSARPTNSWRWSRGSRRRHGPGSTI